MYLVSDALNKAPLFLLFFVFCFQKKRKSQYPLLFKNQTKMKKDTHQVTHLDPDPLSRAFLHWHWGEVANIKNNSPVTEMSSERNELILAFSISSQYEGISCCQTQSVRACVECSCDPHTKSWSLVLSSPLKAQGGENAMIRIFRF